MKFDPAYRSYYAADNYPGPLDYAPQTNVLLHNNCNGTFSDASATSRHRRREGPRHGSDRRGFRPRRLPGYLRRQRQEREFPVPQQGATAGSRRSRSLAGVAYGQNGENTSAMGPVFQDLDQDGRVDLWVSDSKYNRLLKNAGKLQFDDVTQKAGIAQLSAQYVSWGTGVHDFDNDGLDDLFIVHGGLVHLVPQEHSMFRNAGGGKFEDVSSDAGAFFEQKSVGRGAAFADYDNDGRVDCLHREPRRARPFSCTTPHRPRATGFRSDWSAGRAIATASARGSRYWRAAGGRCTNASRARDTYPRTTLAFTSDSGRRRKSTG